MTLTEDDHQPDVDRAVAAARAVEPGLPPGFSAGVMRKVREAEAGFSMFRRWKRAHAARGAALAPAGPAGAKRVLWGVATVGATAVVALLYFGVPQVGPGTAGTVGGAVPADPPPAPALDGMTVQQYLRSEAFASLLRNDSARDVLDRAVRDEGFRKMLTQPALRAGITDPAFHRAAADPSFQALLAWPSFETALATPEFQAAIKPIR
jgi:hypothetical protein